MSEQEPKTLPVDPQDVLGALEAQRNQALNENVNLRVQLQAAVRRILELEKPVANPEV